MLVLITIARRFDEATFGSLMVGATAGLVIGQVADVGLTLVIGADIARRRPRLAMFVGTALAIKAVLWVLGAAALAALHPLLGGGEALGAALILAAALSLDTFTQFSAGGLRAAGAYRLDWFVAVLPRALAVALVVPTALAVSDASVVALAWLAAAAAGSATSLAILHSRVHFDAPRLSAVRGIVSRGWPIGASIVAGMMYTRVAIFLLEALRSSEEVAVYAVALRLIEPAYVLPAAATAIFYPTYVRNIHERHDLARGQLRRWLIAIGGIAALVYIGLAVVGAWVTPLLFGEFYEASGTLLRVAALVVVPGFVSYLLNQALIARGMARYNLLVMSMLFALSVPMNLVAIELWGVWGAAGAAVVTEILLLVAFLRRSRTGELRPGAVGTVA